jgi:hypothetical protein
VKSPGFFEKGGGKKKKKTLVLTLGNPREKGGKQKKFLVLTLGSPPEKGGEKKNLGINLGQVRRLHSKPAGKGRKKKQKKKQKNPGINLGQPAGKGRAKKKKTLVLTLGRPLDFDFRTWTSISRPGPIRPSRS